MPAKKKTPQKHYDILKGMEIADSEPEEQLKLDPAPLELGEAYKPDVEAFMRKEYGELLRSPDATSVLMAILRELVMMRMHA